MKRIFVVDDHALLRRGYRSLFQQHADLCVCGEASGAEEAIGLVEAMQPDLVIADITLEGLNGIELIKRLHALMPGLPVLVVSMHDERIYAERALRAGARGYLMKSRVDTEVVEASRRILDGGFYFSPEVQQRLFLLRQAGAEPTETPAERLSDRELELFEHLGRGLTTQEIAEAMHISPKTVETHRGRIKEKLGVESTAELIRQAVLWTQQTVS
jgi:DNA-binding NarL/FixJ family response regulator